MYLYIDARRSYGLRDMQKELAILPRETAGSKRSPSCSPVAGGSGGLCHTLHLNPGIVSYPSAPSHSSESFAAHMPSLRP